MGKETILKRIADFVAVFWLYKRHHPARYALKLARDIVWRGLPF